MFIEEFQSIDAILEQEYEHAFGKERRYPITSHYRLNLT